MVDTPGIHNEASGTSHGPVVQAESIHQVVLAGNASPASVRVVPRQLPLVVRDFTGRDEHLTALDSLLPSGGNVPGAAVISAVDGAAGIGKTSLAVHWAHRVQHQFPDGTLYVNLRGYGPGSPATAREVLPGFLRALGAPTEAIPADVEAQTALYRTLLAHRQVLVVLDNANEAEQVRPLLPGASGCVVVVTSRDSLTGLVVTDSATRLTLDLLTETEALELVTGIIGPDRAAAEHDAIYDLIRFCARLPLALRIAAGRAAASLYTSVADVVAELADDGYRLDALSRDGDERATVRGVFDWSYHRLTPEQARLFRRLGLHPGPDVSVHAAAALAQQPPHHARRLLDELASAHMIEPAASGRYRFHDLLRTYAADQAHRHDPPTDRKAALHTLLSWYAHTTWHCDQLAYSGPRQHPLHAPVPPDPVPITERAQALNWLRSEQVNILVALRHAASRNLDYYIVNLADSDRFFLFDGNWEAALECAHAGLLAAQRLGDRRAELRFRGHLGETFVDMERWDEALTLFNDALAGSRDLGERMFIAAALNNLGLLALQQDRFEDALPHLEEALPLCPDADSRLKTIIEGNLSEVYSGLGHYQEALEYGERSLTRARQASDPLVEPFALQRVAQAKQGLGEHQQAITLLRHAISLRHTIDAYKYEIAECLNCLAVSLHHTGHTVDAITSWREAVHLYDQYGLRQRADLVRQRLRAAENQPAKNNTRAD
ncbi:ATP-binding protein [Amycolatopsis taiwanensis]|uniref:ATP-binding protein n=1 Tax=Amycolatopsis taiwanensis TaxID=342230 RepID=UPI0004AF13C5|nr:tetratricopeptide repeat protein [Amycolatopsis taiwanensis]